MPYALPEHKIMLNLNVKFELNTLSQIELEAPYSINIKGYQKGFIKLNWH